MLSLRLRKIVLAAIAAIMITACSDATTVETPSAALKSYIAAQQNGDIAAMKQLLSRSSIEFIEKNARVQNKSIDDILREETKVRIAAIPETRNEKIDGETATVEVKIDESGKNDLVYPFVREDGKWKLARDKQVEAILKKANEAREQLIKDVSNASRTNSNR